MAYTTLDKQRAVFFYIIRISLCLICCKLVGIGLQWSNINTYRTADEKFTMSYTLIMLSIDNVLYVILTWYFDAVLPGDFGMPRPFYFPFTVFFTNSVGDDLNFLLVLNHIDIYLLYFGHLNFILRICVMV